VGDRYLIAYGLTYAWIPTFNQGDGTQAVAMIQEGLTIARELGDKRFIADGLSNLGYMTYGQGDLVQAAALIQEAVTIARELGHTPTLAVTLGNLAQIAYEQGDAKQAETLFLESFSFAWEDKYAVWAGASLIGLAMVAEAQGQPTRAARLLGAAEALIDVNKHLTPVERVTYERDVARIRSRLGEEAFTAAWAEGRSMTPEQALAAPEQSITPESVPAVPQSLPEGKLTLPSKPTYPAGPTAREMEVLRLVAQGMTNPQIAERIILSLHTVNAHVRSIYNKLEVNSRSAVTRYALEHHLL
jgi:ATP/maltotriose-dependent transcriptional regulator MalT